MGVTTETMETSLPPTSARSFETVEEIAARFRVSEETARRWLRARKPVVAGAFRAGRRWLLPIELDK